MPREGAGDPVGGGGDPVGGDGDGWPVDGDWVVGGAVWGNVEPAKETIGQIRSTSKTLQFIYTEDHNPTVSLFHELGSRRFHRPVSF